MIYDKRGELRADIGVFAKRTYLTFLDEEGWVGLVMSVDDMDPSLSGLKVYKRPSPIRAKQTAAPRSSLICQPPNMVMALLGLWCP